MSSNKIIEDRLIRIESRLVQIMLHLGLDPYKKTYDATHPTYHPNPAASNDDPQG